MSVGLAKLRRNSDNIRNAELSNLEDMTVSLGGHRKHFYAAASAFKHCHTLISTIISVRNILAFWCPYMTINNVSIHYNPPPRGGFTLILYC